MYNIYEVLEGRQIIAHSTHHQLICTYSTGNLFQVWKEVRDGRWEEKDARSLHKPALPTDVVQEGTDFLDYVVRGGSFT